MNGTMSHFKIKYLTWNSNLVNLSLVKYFERERERERERQDNDILFFMKLEFYIKKIYLKCRIRWFTLVSISLKLEFSYLSFKRSYITKLLQQRFLIILFLQKMNIWRNRP